MHRQLYLNHVLFCMPHIFSEESDAETMRAGRGGGVLGLRLQLERMGLRASSGGADAVSDQPVVHSSYFADVQHLQHQSKAAASALQAHPALSRSASSGAAMSVPSLSLPALNQQQQQQPGSAPASLPGRLPGTQFIV
jgi:hypothetical protein